MRPARDTADPEKDSSWAQHERGFPSTWKSPIQGEDSRAAGTEARSVSSAFHASCARSHHLCFLPLTKGCPPCLPWLQCWSLWDWDNPRLLLTHGSMTRMSTCRHWELRGRTTKGWGPPTWRILGLGILAPWDPGREEATKVCMLPFQ